MVKTYRYFCKLCGGYYETHDRKMPLCRGCLIKELGTVAKTRSTDSIKEEYGEPVPTPIQAAKWQAAKRAQKLLEENK